MTPTLETRLKAAAGVLWALVEKQAEGVPWHYGAQIKKLWKDLGILEQVAYPFSTMIVLKDGTIRKMPTSEQMRADVEFARHVLVVEALDDILNRLRASPIARPEIAAKAEDLVPLLKDFQEEVLRLEPTWMKEEREAGL